MSEPTENALKFPIEKRFSSKIRGRYGYKDGRAEVSVKVGGIIPWTDVLTQQDIDDAVDFLIEAQRFARMSEEDRERLGAE